jgi:adenosylcobinamide-GDP ribazoletransferase
MIQRFLGAIGFLTSIPLPKGWADNDSALVKTLAFFPLVGLLIGALLALVGSLSGWIWGNWVGAMAVVVTWGIVSGGLHLDGLSDTFDGMMSWRPRERKLEIMRDSRVGVMGVLALVAVFGLKVALLAQSEARLWLWALLLAPVCGRWAMCYGVCSYPSARSDGLGAQVQAEAGFGQLRVATIIALLLALLLTGLQGLIALALVWLAARWLARWWTRELGGLTGDTYGALCEIAEVVALAALTAQL